MCETMARFKIGDKARTITGYAQMQYSVSGQCYSTPSWKVRIDNGEVISIDERYLNQTKKGDIKREFCRTYKGH